MSDRVDRFKKRQAIIGSREAVTVLPAVLQVQKLAQQSVDQSFIDSAFSINATPVYKDATPEEIQDVLNDILNEYDEQRFNKTISELRRDVINSIAGPFGIGTLVAAYDKTGGNVDTVHNARSGIYATEAEQDAHEHLEAYTKDSRTVVDNDPRFKKAKKQAENDKESGLLKDAYTGEIIKATDTHTQDRQNVDHVNSVKSIYNDPGRVLAELKTEDLANADTNFAITRESLNKTKRDRSVDDMNSYIAEKTEAIPGRIEKAKHNVQTYTEELSRLKALNQNTPYDLERIQKLEGKVKINNDLQTKLNHQLNYDPELAKKVDEKAKRDLESSINKAYYGSDKFALNTARTSGIEGAKMGAQAAFGMMLAEFMAAVFDEAQDWYKSGRTEAKFINELGVRFIKVSERVYSKWRSALTGFGKGAISGFLSNIITVLINAFLTTGKRLVRMIRQGFFELCGAIKLLIIRPEGMTHAEALDAASKAFVAGSIMIGGIALEQFVENQFAAWPIISAFASILAPVVVGSLTALITTFVIYMMDKADLFGARQANEQKTIGQQLDSRIEVRLERIQLLLS